MFGCFLSKVFQETMRIFEKDPLLWKSDVALL